MSVAPASVQARWRNEKRATVVAFSALFLLAILVYTSFPLHKL